MTIPTHLIENALNLTGKTMEEFLIKHYDNTVPCFSIEKFSYYLLSIEFAIEYLKAIGSGYTKESYELFGLMVFSAIGLYQSGNPEPLISLLEKICTQPNSDQR